MWWITIVIVSIANQQMVSALSCYSCDTPTSCRQPSTQQCTAATADATTNWLSAIHTDVPQVTGNGDYKCLNIIYYAPESKITVFKYLGCLHANINACNLTLSLVNLAPECNTCNWNYCNSAVTFGKNIYTVVTSTLLMILGKFALS